MEDRLSGEEDPDNPSSSGSANGSVAAGHFDLIAAYGQGPLSWQVGSDPVHARLVSAVIEDCVSYVDHFTTLWVRIVIMYGHYSIILV